MKPSKFLMISKIKPSSLNHYMLLDFSLYASQQLFSMVELTSILMRKRDNEALLNSLKIQINYHYYKLNRDN